MKRWEIVDILREILRVCGHVIKVEMIWLKGVPDGDGIEDGKYQIVMRAIFDKDAVACLLPINEKYKLEMKQEDDLWIFTKEKNGSKRVAPSASAV